MKIVYHVPGNPTFFGSVEEALRVVGIGAAAQIRGTATTERPTRWGVPKKYCATFFPSQRTLNKAKAKVSK